MAGLAYGFQQTAGVVASPEDVGLSSERLERIAGVITQSINEGRIAGAVALVARHGKIAYFKAFGMADREAKKPMRTDNIFRIFSMSKPITSVAVMMLYEEGRFMLNEPVSDLIPEFKNMKVLDPPFPQRGRELGVCATCSPPARDISDFRFKIKSAGSYPIDSQQSTTASQQSTISSRKSAIRNLQSTITPSARCPRQKARRPRPQRELLAGSG
jgi:hypothetical protein